MMAMEFAEEPERSRVCRVYSVCLGIEFFGLDVLSFVLGGEAAFHRADHLGCDRRIKIRRRLYLANILGP